MAEPKLRQAGKTWDCTYTHRSQAAWAPGTPGIHFWTART